MAEALGIFCGSVQLLDKLVKLSDVAKSAMDAPDDIAALARDLGDLKLLFDTKVKDLPKEGLAVLEEPIGHFEKDLETLLEGLKNLDLKKTKRIRWVVSKSKDYSQAAGRLEKYKSLFELAIAGDMRLVFADSGPVLLVATPADFILSFHREVGKMTFEIVHSLKKDMERLVMSLAETERKLLAKADQEISQSNEMSRGTSSYKSHLPLCTTVEHGHGCCATSSENLCSKMLPLEIGPVTNTRFCSSIIEIAGIKRQRVSEEVENTRARLVSELCQFDFNTTQQDMFAAHQKGTGGWFLKDERFEKWLREKRSILFCPGIRESRPHPGLHD